GILGIHCASHDFNYAFEQLISVFVQPRDLENRRGLAGERFKQINIILGKDTAVALVERLRAADDTGLQLAPLLAELDTRRAQRHTQNRAGHKAALLVHLFVVAPFLADIFDQHALASSDHLADDTLADRNRDLREVLAALPGGHVQPKHRW